MAFLATRIEGESFVAVAVTQVRFGSAPRDMVGTRLLLRA